MKDSKNKKSVENAVPLTTTLPLFAPSAPFAKPMDKKGKLPTKVVGKPQNSMQGQSLPEFFSPLQLDPQQLHAIHAGTLPLFVRGGPATGKTTLLAERILYLFDEGIAPDKILVITPNRGAAASIDRYLQQKQQQDFPLPQADTLSALALGLWHALHKDLPILLNSHESEQLFYMANADAPEKERKEAWEAFAFSKKTAQPLPEKYALWQDRYFRHKQAWNLADAPDLIEFWLAQIGLSPKANVWSQILVEDAHLFAAQELHLIQALLPSSAEGFFAVGDVSQSPVAQSLCVADPEGFFREHWPHLHSHTLFCNYRAGKKIVDVLNVFQEPSFTFATHDELAIADAQRVEHEGVEKEKHAKAEQAESGEFEKEESRAARKEIQQGTSQKIIADAEHQQATSLLFPLQAGKKEQGLAHLLVTANENEEILWIVEQLERLFLPEAVFLRSEKRLEKKSSVIAKTLTPGHYSAQDIVIAVRNHEFAEKLQQRLPLKMHEPLFFDATSTSAFQHDERIILILHMAGQLLGIVLEESEKRYMCPETIIVKGPLAVAAYFSETPPFDSAFWHSSAFRSLISMYDECGGWAELFTFLALHTARDLIKPVAQTISILTYEEMQNQEFAIVFMPGLEDGFVPFAGKTLFSGRIQRQSESDVAGERRLFFSTMSRAKNALLLSCTRTRPHLKGVRLQPSRFLQEIPKEMLSTSVLVREHLAQEEQLLLLK